MQVWRNPRQKNVGGTVVAATPVKVSHREEGEAWRKSGSKRKNEEHRGC
jgi:hypothetical protein